MKKKNSDTDKKIKELKKQIEELRQGGSDPTEAEAALAEAEKKIFVPIFGCEMYVADGDMTDRSSKKIPDGI